MKLEFSFIGMKSQILLYKGKELRVTMEENSYELDAVNIVETGYQTIDRRHLTSAVTSVRAEDILIPRNDEYRPGFGRTYPGLDAAEYFRNSGGHTPYPGARDLDDYR